MVIEAIIDASMTQHIIKLICIKEKIIDREFSKLTQSTDNDSARKAQFYDNHFHSTREIIKSWWWFEVWNINQWEFSWFDRFRVVRWLQQRIFISPPSLRNSAGEFKIPIQFSSYRWTFYTCIESIETFNLYLRRYFILGLFFAAHYYRDVLKYLLVSSDKLLLCCQ